MTTKTLLIWDSFGEDDLRFYVIDDAPSWLTKCHHEYINVSNNGKVCRLLNRINDAITTQPEYYMHPEDDLAGAWVKSRVDSSSAFTLEGSFKIVVTGFVP